MAAQNDQCPWLSEWACSRRRTMGLVEVLATVQVCLTVELGPHGGTRRPRYVVKHKEMFWRCRSGYNSLLCTTDQTGPPDRQRTKNAAVMMIILCVRIINTVQVKLAAEENKTEETSPVHMRPGRVSQHAKDNRHTMPANAYTPKQVRVFRSYKVIKLLWGQYL